MWNLASNPPVELSSQPPVKLSFQPPVELSFQPLVEVQSGTCFHTLVEPPRWNPLCGSSLELSKPSEKTVSTPLWKPPPVEVQSGTRFQTPVEPPLWKFTRVPGSKPLWNHPCGSSIGYRVPNPCGLNFGVNVRGHFWSQFWGRVIFIFNFYLINSFLFRKHIYYIYRLYKNKFMEYIYDKILANNLNEKDKQQLEIVSQRYNNRLQQ